MASGGTFVAANLARRHLDESQRAMIAAKVADRRKGQTKTGDRLRPAAGRGWLQRRPAEDPEDRDLFRAVSRDAPRATPRRTRRWLDRRPQ